MIQEGTLTSNTRNTISDDDEQDTNSITTSETDSEYSGVLTDAINKEQPCFGNIAVKNSSDVHFGNKTYYQGPVTIKQILYANSQNSDCDSEVPTICSVEKDNPGFVPDSLKVNVKTETFHQASVIEERQPERKGRQWLQNFSRHHVLLIVSLVTVLLLSLVTLLAVLLTKQQPLLPQYPEDSDEQDNGIPPQYPVDSNDTITREFHLITRNEWLAKPAKEQFDVLSLPVPYVLIMHTASDFCTNESTCKKIMREIQEFHAHGRNWSDIGYNFVVGGDGNAYVGRGWYAVGAQVYGYNKNSIGIAFIGTFNQVLPPEEQLTAAKEIINRGLNLRVIAPDYKILAARQLQTTQSPGEALYKLIKTWDHWSPTP